MHAYEKWDALGPKKSFIFNSKNITNQQVVRAETESNGIFNHNIGTLF